MPEAAFRFGDLPAPLPPELRALADGLEPAALGHLLDQGFTGPRHRHLAGRREPSVGMVVTCLSPGADNAIVHHAVSRLRPGDFLVIARGPDRPEACLGGGLALAAERAGCAGILVDGPVTDVQELRQLALPVWAVGLTALTCKRHYEGGTFCEPVSIDGMDIAPGMLALGDENGVLFVDGPRLLACAPEAKARQSAQAERYARVRAGGRLAALNGTDEAFARILAETAR
ncbi:RraA family protein [Pigmentiphaga sp. H8]|uniref:RraA family protein n=1 Tax=Pigmentiphaga sp. H8 TaxID=2488560 RepID=UPI000F5B7E02|nr:RraA family protein [Pigmentiphaga sp. H8]AZG10608.1 RraA family protein [Pigmentiphaga sp. H8]